MQRILNIEDNALVQKIVTAALPGFLVDHASTLKEAEKNLRQETYALILLDIELPDGDGIAFYSTIKDDPKFQPLPVIVVSARKEIAQKVIAFSLGIDDFMVKPVDPLELRARVELRLKKAASQKKSSDSLKIHDLVLSHSQQRVWISHESTLEPVSLTSLEFRLLWMLAKHVGQVFSRERLLEAIWARGTHVVDRTVDAHIGHLRKKLSQSSIRIETVLGEGYRLAFDGR